MGAPDVGSDKAQPADQQARRRPRRKRTREDRERRDAAFAPKQRGRPKGSRLKFFEDADRFAVAIVECATEFRGMPLYHAADIAVALTSDAPIEAASIGHIAETLAGPNPTPYVRFSGGTKHATLKGAAGGLVAKVKAPRTREETEWIRSSAAGLDALLDMHSSSQPALGAPYLRVVFDFLAVRGWTPVLQKIIEKLSPAMRSNFPPAEQPPNRRTLDLLWPKPKS